MPLGIYRGGGLRLRPRRRLRLAGARQDVVEPGGCFLLVHVLGVHELRGEDLLRLDEHLLLAGRKTLLVVPDGEVSHDFRELEDVAGLHLVAVVLEPAIPVLGHLRGTSGEGPHHHRHRPLVYHLTQPHSLCVLARNVDGHVVVQDLNRQVLTRLAKYLTLLLANDSPRPVVWIDHLVAYVEQASLPGIRLHREKVPAATSLPATGT